MRKWMRGILTAAAATGLLCGGVDSAAAQATVEVTEDLLIGRWTDTDDCTDTVLFRPDGTFETPAGEGIWALDGDRLIFQGSSTVSARIRVPDRDTIVLIHDDGTLGRSTRCPWDGQVDEAPQSIATMRDTLASHRNEPAAALFTRR